MPKGRVAAGQDVETGELSIGSPGLKAAHSSAETAARVSLSTVVASNRTIKPRERAAVEGFGVAQDDR